MFTAEGRSGRRVNKVIKRRDIKQRDTNTTCER